VNTYYLDAAIELLQSIINDVELHVIIEISPESATSNIIEVENLNNFNTIELPSIVLGIEKWNELSKHFIGVASVHFAVFKNKKSFSIASLSTVNSIATFIKNITPNAIHFDSITPRILGLLPYILNKKIFITVHDPLPHSGEGSWKIKLTEFLYFTFSNGLFFYSKFAKKQFNESHLKFKAKQYNILFQPFTFLQQFKNCSKITGNTILFFGRIVFYKGVDILLTAIPKVISKYPNEIFVIAGKLQDDILDKNILNDYPNNIQLLPHHISTGDLANLIESSKFVVCPYRDATQSGVLMTANAFGKTVVATNVGAFPEYILNDYNGLLSLPDADSIANTIIKALDNSKYNSLELNVQSERSPSILIKNNKALINAYTYY
jgi:glycosyltransferase involved in cell wall biosynthesis